VRLRMRRRRSAAQRDTSALEVGDDLWVSQVGLLAFQGVEARSDRRTHMTTSVLLQDSR
jgi:hypothetical protein